MLLMLACQSADKPSDDSVAADSTSTVPDSPAETGTETAETADATETADSEDSGTTSTEPQPILVFEGTPPTNLLVISLDTTRRDQIGFFSGLDTTPNLDLVLAESVVLADHRSCSNWTAPSAMCVQTGRFPVEEGYWPSAVYASAGPDPDVTWPPEEMPTISLALSDAGYRTTLVTANGVFSDNNPGVAWGFQQIRKQLWQPAESISRRALTETQQTLAEGLPWYLHFHYADPHGPYQAPAEFDTESEDLPPIRWDVTDTEGQYEAMWSWGSMSPEEQELVREHLLAVYRAELRYWDDDFGKLWTSLDAMGALDDTLVVFWTDHGEQFGEHGEFQHGVSLYGEENRSTAFFWAENLLPVEWMGPTVHQDLAPTILQALGQPPDPGHTGAVVGLAPDDRVLVQFNYLNGWASPDMAVTIGTERLLYNFDGRRWFYDVATDPGEVTDIYFPTDARVVALWDELTPRVRAVEAMWPVFTPVQPWP